MTENRPAEGPGDLLHLRFLRTAKRHWASFCMADSTGRPFTYGQALVGALLLARRIRAACPNQMLGLLLPASVGGALANIATLLAGKVAVNLNFTAGHEAMHSAVQQCGIATILTSRAFLARAKLDEKEGMVFLEDVLRQFGSWQKFRTALAAFLLPSALLQSLYAREPAGPDSLATVIFSSGSTGMPKGVMLSHQNILANLEAFSQLFSLSPADRMMGILPFFHSFGYTVTLWFPAVTGMGAVYHNNPLDAKTVGEMVSRYRATVLLATPTFFAAYLRKCSAEQFSSLRYAIAGGERLPEPLASAFREKYRLELLQGYGCTEMAPVISGSSTEDAPGGKKNQKRGTVGRLLPGVEAKVVDPDTGEGLPAGREGLLLVRGPNRMIGYLGQPEMTAAALRDGWYVTGDIASIDEEGFLRITDRVARFSKIGGEMVPHGRIEEAIGRIMIEKGGAEGLCSVTAVPDEQRGERLVAFYTNQALPPKELWERLCQSELPRLWVPKPENFCLLESLPMLGTGKVDLKRLKVMAREWTRARADADETS